jgi:outer membrane protein assembly factor BamB
MRKTAVTIVCIIIATNLALLPSVGADWPMFLHDAAHSGFTMSAGATKPVKIWSYTESDDVSFSVSSAAVVNGIVYVGSYHVDGHGGNIYAFNAYTGAKVWNYSTQAPVYSSPAVSEKRVFVGDGLNVLALDASTGAKIWNYTTKGFAGYSSFVVVDGVVSVASEDDVYAFDASTGIKIWNYTTGVGPYGSHGIASSPAVAEGIVYITAFDGNTYALNAFTGAKIWNTTAGGGYSSPAVAGDTVYVGSDGGSVYALNALSGEKVWSFQTLFYSKLGGIEASPAVVDGVVYVGSKGGGLYALNASTGAQIWNFKNMDTVYSSAAVSNGVVYISSLAVNASTGEEIWRFPTGGTHASPAVVNGVVYIGSSDGNFYAIGEPLTMPSPNPSSFPINWLVTAIVVLTVFGIALLLYYFKKRKHQAG